MVINISSIGGQAALKFAEIVEQKTGGEYKVIIYEHAMLGTAREQVEGLAEGAIHIYIDEMLAFECMAGLCGPTGLPFFFRDGDHYMTFLQSKIFEEHIFESLLKKGIRLLKPISNWGSNSFEMLLSTEPIFSPQDLAGRKFRSYDSPAAISLRRVLRAEPVILEWTSSPQAFKEGHIDTFLIPSIYLNALQPYEFAQYATLIDYGYTIGLTIAVNEHAYCGMSPDLQSALIDAAQEASAYCTPLVEEQKTFTMEQFPTAYEIPVIHPDKNAWRERMDAVIRQICVDGLLPREIFDEIQSL
jgi:TRAP-type C4-dicarboxylate transport system substrate-binding protein